MNSGCYDCDISKVLISINVLDTNKITRNRNKKRRHKFFYRGTNLPDNFIIISAKLKVKESKKEIIEKKQRFFIEKKNFLSQVKLKPVEALLKI